jgi:hypothetical protein
MEAEMRLASLSPLVLALVACANHPVDCAVGIEHRDCLPGTAGHQARQERLAGDQAACIEYGFQQGSEGYAQCRMLLDRTFETERTQAIQEYFDSLVADRPQITTTTCTANEYFDEVRLRCESRTE